MWKVSWELGYFAGKQNVSDKIMKFHEMFNLSLLQELKIPKL